MRFASVDLSPFEYVTANNTIFPTPKGSITIIQLWRVPLDGDPAGVDLNTIAKTIHKQIKDNTENEVDFVGDEDQAKKDLLKELNCMLDVVKRIITVKKAEKKFNQEAKSRAEFRQQLLAVKMEKKKQRLGDLSEAEIDKMLEELQ